MTADLFEFPALDPAGHALASGSTPLDRAVEIIEQARGDARRISENAEREGWNAGYEAGFEQARVDVERQLDLLGAALEAMEAARAQASDLLERRAVDLSLLLAEKILAGALGVQPAVTWKPPAAGDVPVMLADVTRLAREAGFHAQVPLAAGLARLLPR